MGEYVISHNNMIFLIVSVSLLVLIIIGLSVHLIYVKKIHLNTCQEKHKLEADISAINKSYQNAVSTMNELAEKCDELNKN